ncbi:MAG: DUF6249 domain-containing protein [Prevotellaceae bacterium]|jgi:hypothetical protein|nr:DUF6249 domain-containing protein [Prevotellaceae bacterium]
MKQKTFALLLIACLAALMPVHAARRKVVENDSLGNPKRVIELNDTTIDGKSVTDTLSVMTYMQNAPATATDGEWKRHTEGGGWNIDFGGWDKLPQRSAFETLIAVIFLIFFFGMPLFIVFVVLHFRYKSRQARYKLAEQALAAGQPMPEAFVRKIETKSNTEKGITNMALGLGLFIFLWALTTSFGIGTIGILVFCIGVGQYINAKNKQQKEHGEE